MTAIDNSIMGIKNYRDQHYQEALRLLDKSLIEYPHSEVDLFYKAQTLIQLEKFKDAMEYAQKAMNERFGYRFFVPFYNLAIKNCKNYIITNQYKKAINLADICLTELRTNNNIILKREFWSIKNQAHEGLNEHALAQDCAQQIKEIDDIELSIREEMAESNEQALVDFEHNRIRADDGVFREYEYLLNEIEATTKTIQKMERENPELRWYTKDGRIVPSSDDDAVFCEAIVKEDLYYKDRQYHLKEAIEKKKEKEKGYYMFDVDYREWVRKKEMK